MSIDKLPKILGYENRTIPSYDQLWRFANERIGADGIKELFYEMVKINLEEGLRCGIKIGNWTMIDGCPIEACPNDKVGTWSGHYHIRCYLWHNYRCFDTGIPLWFELTHGTDNNGRYLIDALEKCRTLGVDTEKIYFDCGYASYKNFAIIGEDFGADVCCNIANNWRPMNDGSIKRIYEIYQKIHWYHDWKPTKDLKQIFKYLRDHGKGDVVGMYYRNEIMAKYEEAPDSYMDDYHHRNRIENEHGNEKRIGNIERTEVRGNRNNTVQLGLHLLALNVIANTRMRYGVKEDLINIGHIR